MKYQRTMPEDNQGKSFPIVSEGTHDFQITDIHSENEEKIVVKCEVISEKDNGVSVLHNVSNNQSNNFFWLTKLFLKCIAEPHNGDVTIDPNEWIGKQFTGKVKHTVGKDGKTYANIRELIPNDKVQPMKNVNPNGTTEPSEIVWDS